MLDRRSLTRAAWPALILGGLLAGACLRPPTVGSAASESGNTAQSSGKAGEEIVAYYEPTWGDASGMDGKGGVQLLLSGQRKLPLARSDFRKDKRGDKVTGERPEWLLFHGPADQSLAFEFKWITRADDKFYGNTWAGGGLAFNTSWSAVDASQARHLVLWVKSNKPGVELAVKLQSLLKGKGKEGTGTVELAKHASGGRLDHSWRRVVIPLSAFPEIEQVDLKGLHQVLFELRGGYPENEKVTVLVDNVYLTNLDMVMPVSNPGYLVQRDGVLLEWDKDPTEKVQGYSISVNGKEALAVAGNARSAFLPHNVVGQEARAVIGITTVGANERSEPRDLTVATKPAPEEAGEIKLAAPAHAISPYVFGTNWGPDTSVEDSGVTVRRWGGNRTSKYNWRGDVDSAGSDWYFLNDYATPPGSPEQEKKYYRFIKQTLAAGAEVNFCIPISEWIAKPHPDEKGRYCSYPTSLYPAQEKTDGQGCGNGKKPNGEIIWDNDPNLGMLKNSPEFQRDFVQTVVQLFGPASKGGVEFWSLDNEPGLWMHTHRDTMPRGISAQQLADWNIQYARIVKSADPSAKVLGFGAWGVLELAGSNIDYLPSGTDAHKRANEGQKEENRYRERKKLGGDSQLVYLLKRFKQAEAEHGRRLVDIIDIHWYPELYGKTGKGEKKRVIDDLPYDPVFARLQWEALREWYDPAFKPSAELTSWTTDGNNGRYLWDPHHPVIPALKKLIETHYPGTKLAINEYDTGSPEHYHGALLRAAALGIFMQEDLYMAQNWHQTDDDKFTYFAQKLYGNYDGRGSRVSGRFVPSTSNHPDLLSYAATNKGRFTVVLINKNPTKRINATLELPTPGGDFRAYTLAETLGLRLLETRGKTAGKRLGVTLPPYAAMLVTTE